ncbi:MAG: flippase-like domain-containing protein [Deltaproteobacteria bacterium]|nr:flippase-like domain-containing protein [Deltaproteobacteria bacterium]
MNVYSQHKVKLSIGILVSALCIYLAFRKVDFSEMLQAFQTANYWYLMPAAGIIFFSHLLRAFRWRYLLDPIRRLDISDLFSSLIIGYAANTFLPAHLGEFLRAYVLGKNQKISMSPVFATIVVERIIDVFSLLALMLLALFIYPFPEWVIESGYIMLAGTIGLLIFLIFLKKATSPTMQFISFIMKPLPEPFEHKTKAMLEKFLAGLLPMKRWSDYITVSLLSFIIWICYGFVFFFCLHAFDFVETYHLEWSTSLILLVITTIAVVVPSSPGYVGTYHYLCQITLAMFGVSAGPALSFATVVHGVCFIPVFIVGLFFAHLQGTAILKMPEDTVEVEEGPRSGEI